MEGNTFNQSGISQGGAMPPQQSPNLQKESSGGKGAFIGAIIIVILLIVAGIYIWKTQGLLPTGNDMSEDERMMIEKDINNLPDPSLESLSTQGADDSIESIEVDVESTNLEGLDAELEIINQELQGT